MRQLHHFLFLLFIATGSFAQNVGIGTGNPNSSAILDLTSTSKGLLLPRVADTSNVSTPAEGLVVYNRADKAPNYFDGNRWNNVADARNNFVPVEGFIKYTISGITSIGGMAVQTGLLDAVDYNNAFRAPRNPTGPNQLKGIDSVVLEKEFDGNSIVLKRALLAGNIIPTIEIHQFLPGATTPFYSVKLTSARILEQSFYISEKTGRLTEKYGIVISTIGFRDLVSGKSFSYNISTNSFGTY
jgi:type VI protein secretion system component Hcp